MSELSKIANELLSKSAKFVNEKNGPDTPGHQYDDVLCRFLLSLSKNLAAIIEAFAETRKRRVTLANVAHVAKSVSDTTRTSSQNNGTMLKAMHG